jgi:hypothetical protein
VLAWGANDAGQLGDGTLLARSYAVPVSGISLAIDVAAGATHSVALGGGGRVSTWGSDSRGQLGNGDGLGSLVPGLVLDPCSSDGVLHGVVAIAAGNSHTMARGSILAWGAGDQGQIGDGANVDRQLPTRIRFSDPPNCGTAVVSPASLFPPNHKLNSVVIQGVVSFTGAPAAVRFSHVTQDEPVDGPGQGNSPDAIIGGGGTTLQLRAERAGQGDGRVYHVEFVATDAIGSECRGEVTVCVPHSKNSSCVDGGDLFDSTQTSAGALCSVAPEDTSCDACVRSACCDDLAGCNEDSRCGADSGELACLNACMLGALGTESSVIDVLPDCVASCKQGGSLAPETKRLVQCIAEPRGPTGETCAAACWGEEPVLPAAEATGL